jgi:hypothetical protein
VKFNTTSAGRYAASRYVGHCDIQATLRRQSRQARRAQRNRAGAFRIDAKCAAHVVLTEQIHDAPDANFVAIAKCLARPWWRLEHHQRRAGDACLSGQANDLFPF